MDPEEVVEEEQIATVHNLDDLRRNIHGEEPASFEPTLWDTATAALEEGQGFLDGLGGGTAELVNYEHDVVAVVGALIETLAAYATLYRGVVRDLDRASSDFRSYVNAAVQQGHVA